MTFQKFHQNIYLRILEKALEEKITRKIFLFKLKRKLYYSLTRETQNLKKVQLRKYQWLKSLIEKLFQNLEEGVIKIELAKKLLFILGQNFLLDKFSQTKIQRKDFKRKYKISPPSFIVLSPTQKCNLKCLGCYAQSSIKSFQTLEFKIVKRILKENHDLFGSRFVVISGGEPLLYQNQGKNLFDVFQLFPDTYFIFYTNGILITEKVAQSLAKLGNVSPQISVEGFEEETDERRGKGIFKKVLKAIENLKKFGVPFSISVTATSKNIETLLNNKFYQFWFDQQKASYMWIFQFMPIGRGKKIFDLMPSPSQRLKLFRKWEELLEKGYPVADFWNSGILSNGCIAYGREGGYLYIDWSGKIMPCVFIPYWVDDVYHLYRKGKTLVDALFSDFFKRGRKWQINYGYQKNPREIKNWLMPCSIRDHYNNFFENILGKEVKGENVKVKNYKEYFENLLDYEKKLSKLTVPIWENEYKNFKKKRKKFAFLKIAN